MDQGQILLSLALLLLVSLGSFILVTIICWRANVETFKSLVAWFRSLPGWWRMRRDPVFRREQECIATYNAVIMTLYACRGQKTLQQAELDGANEEGGWRRRRLEKELDRTCEDFTALRGYAATYLAGLSDADIVILAAWLSRESFGGVITPDEVAAFLRDERQLLAGHPVMVVEHLERQIRTLGALYQSRQPPPSGQA